MFHGATDGVFDTAIARDQQSDCFGLDGELGVRLFFGRSIRLQCEYQYQQRFYENSQKNCRQTELSGFDCGNVRGCPFDEGVRNDQVERVYSRRKGNVSMNVDNAAKLTLFP